MKIETPMSVLPASLAESDRLFPTPEAESQRTAKRVWILNYVPRGDAGAEIGAARGHFSEVLLQHLKPRRAWFMDAWALRPPAVCPGSVAGHVAHQETRWRTERFTETECHFIEAVFPDGVGQIGEPLDWLYLDATHDFDTAFHELQMAEKLLKPKGILFGDGWQPDPKSSRHGVFQAVGKLIRQGKFELIACGPYGQWAVRRRGPWKLKPPEAAGGFEETR
jgi:hypothetical protein